MGSELCEAKGGPIGNAVSPSGRAADGLRVAMDAVEGQREHAQTT
jgi:hypothetical protein